VIVEFFEWPPDAYPDGGLEATASGEVDCGWEAPGLPGQVLVGGFARVRMLYRSN